jgi:2,4-dienoyl-CoA reductase-like NADH-dependent reductase (Old Yellow Enzyme family)
MSDRKSSVVFAPGRIGGLEIRNRLVRSATFEHAATSGGEVSPALEEMHRALARADRVDRHGHCLVSTLACRRRP